ncbi:hypothetical protein L207DRAFT_566238 [Hyaloscypha variabilis F]|uniref:Uncharacterized protein n=1 Tax=Hyaloscypha variabilis (strain UAMH 11265 / GT02V1 / F) TaxID=1149755 RepID=A0A2J6RQU1_HYAVF|nr:hypothetical protein L207DRAFT_566238 [Hyaloscypha variabilis F]
MSNYNLGPLTTTFTPAPTCTVPVIACSTCNYGWAAQTCFSGGVEDYTACWPGTSSGVPAPTPPLQGWVSTRLACGYACTTQASGTGTCALVATSTGIPVSTCSSGKAEPISTIAVPLTVAGKLEATAFTVYAPLFQLVYQKTDTATPSNSSSGTKSKVTATASSGKNSSIISGGAPYQTSSLIGYTPGSAQSVTQNVQSSSTSSGPSSTSSTQSSGVCMTGNGGIKRYIALGFIAAFVALVL